MNKKPVNLNEEEDSETFVENLFSAMKIITQRAYITTEKYYVVFISSTAEREARKKRVVVKRFINIGTIYFNLMKKQNSRRYAKT